MFLVYLTTALTFVGAVLGWTFVVQYGRVDYRATDEGKHIMGFTLAVAISLTLATLVRLFSPQPARSLWLQIVGVLLYAWIDYLLASRVRLLRRANRDAE